MKGLYSWATSPFTYAGSALYQTGYNVASCTYNVAAAAGNVVYDAAAYIGSYFSQETIEQFWPGLTRVSEYIATAPDFVKQKTLVIGAYMTFDNLIVQAGGVLLSKYLINQLTYELKQKAPIAGNLAELTFNLVTDTVFTYNHAFLQPKNKILYPLALTEAAYQDNINDGSFEPDNPVNFDVVKASAASNVYFMVNYAFVSALSFMLDKLLGSGQPLGFILKAFVYGQALDLIKILETTPPKDIYKELSKNNLHSLGTGISFYGTYKILIYLLQRVTGVSSWLVDSAIMAVWYQYNGLVSMLSKKPLPGKKIGKDLGFYLRSFTDFVGQTEQERIIGKKIECDLLTAGILPNKKDFDFEKIPGQANTAIIIVGEKLFYMNREEKYLELIPNVRKEQIEKLKRVLGIPFIAPNDKLKYVNNLSPDLLTLITLITGYTHPQASTDWIKKLSGMVNYKLDCDLLLMRLAPKKEDLGSVPGTASTALVFNDKELIFVDKKNEKIERLEIPADKLDKLKIALNIPLKTIEEDQLLRKDINYETLQLISLLTDFHHPNMPDIIDILSAAGEMPMVQEIKEYLPTDYKSKEDFLNSKVMHMAMNLFADKVRAGNEYLLKVRNEPLVGPISHLPEPFLDPGVRKSIHILLEKWLDNVFEECNRYIYYELSKLAHEAPIKDLDEAEKNLKAILQLFDEHSYQLHGGELFKQFQQLFGMKKDDGDFSKTAKKLRPQIENALGKNGQVFSEELYTETVDLIRNELFDKTYATNGFLYTGLFARDESTAQLYRNVLLLCRPINTKLAAVAAPTLTEEDIKIQKAREHLEAIRAALKDFSYVIKFSDIPLIGPGRTLPGDTSGKKYPDNAYGIITFIDNVLTPSAHKLTIKIHNDTEQHIRKLLQKAINDENTKDLIFRDRTTKDHYISVLAMCNSHEVNNRKSQPKVPKVESEVVPEKINPSKEEATPPSPTLPKASGILLFDNYSPPPHPLANNKVSPKSKHKRSSHKKNPIFSNDLMPSPRK